MQELEEKIAAWRAQLLMALPGRHETVDELEAHLRDHLERALASGTPVEKALAEGIARIGDAGALVRQFELASRQRTASWPMIVIYGLVALPAIALLVEVCLHVSQGRLPLVQGIQAMLTTTGCLALLGSGLTGCWTLVALFSRLLSDRNVSLQRRTMLRFLITGSIVLPLGIVLATVWPPVGGTGPHASTEIGSVTALISMWILLLLHGRMIEGTSIIRMALSLLGASVVYAGWILADVRTAIPIAWLSIASVLAYGSTALLHVRRVRQIKAIAPSTALD